MPSQDETPNLHNLWFQRPRKLVEGQAGSHRPAPSPCPFLASNFLASFPHANTHPSVWRPPLTTESILPIQQARNSREHSPTRLPLDQPTSKGVEYKCPSSCPFTRITWGLCSSISFPSGDDSSPGALRGYRR